MYRPGWWIRSSLKIDEWGDEDGLDYLSGYDNGMRKLVTVITALFAAIAFGLGPLAVVAVVTAVVLAAHFFLRCFVRASLKYCCRLARMRPGQACSLILATKKLVRLTDGDVFVCILLGGSAVHLVPWGAGWTTEYPTQEALTAAAFLDFLTFWVVMIVTGCAIWSYRTCGAIEYVRYRTMEQ